MKQFLLALALIFTLNAPTLIQAQDTKAQKSTAILEKMRQIDLLVQILPLALKKEQLKEILPAVEKARRDVKTQQDDEANLLASYSAKIEKAVKDGIETGDVPDKKLLAELNAMVNTMSMKREAVASDNIEMVLTAMKKALNAGQLKVAANSLNPKLFLGSDVKVEEMKEDDKLKLFVRVIMLDPLAYDLLVKISNGPRG